MKRSKCPISNALDYLGDKWSLLILRDIILYDKRTYKDLQESDEKIATNILSDRLLKLESAGLIERKKHPKDKRRSIYISTSKGIDLIPLLIEMILWSKKYYPETFTPDEFLEQLKTNKEETVKKLILEKKSTQTVDSE